MMISLYRIFSYIAYPFLFIAILVRVIRGKEVASRCLERFGITSQTNPNKKVIWMHAASVGEVFSIVPLIWKISKKNPDLFILVTTGTKNSAKIIANKLPENSCHQFIPLDSDIAIQKFLNFWNPQLVIWTESEFWPNLLRKTCSRAPILLVNGRISDSSFASWSKHPNSIKKILGCFSFIMSQSRQDFQRFKELGAKNVFNTGNLKYSSPPPKADESELIKLKTVIGKRRVFMAASTHKGEEEQIANVHDYLKGDHPDILTIIAPRHPHRMKEIVERITSIYDLNISIRSLGDPIEDDTDIYIADTMGEYGIFYRLSQIVFVGGSLIEHGGQNILEPARLDNVVICGPHMYNFAEITKDFVENEAIIQVEDDEKLYLVTKELFSHMSRLDKYIKAAKKMVNKTDHIIDIVIEKIEPFIKRL